MARPLLQIDSKEVEKLASIGCSNSEIAAFFECSKDTIEGRFSAELHKGRENGKTRLRRWQLQSAEKGNVAMLIWLGKQMLGQKDKQEIDHNNSDGNLTPQIQIFIPDNNRNKK
jgi:hypothetical protein